MATQNTSPGLRTRRTQQAKLFLLVLPFLILLALFTYVPLFGWSYAFVKYVPGKSVFESTWMGLEYFKLIGTMYGENFLIVLRNTFALSGLNILSTVFPVLVAILITLLRSKRYSKACQTIISIPYFISWVLVYSVVFLVVASDTSAYNTAMQKLHLADGPVNILAMSEGAWFVQICIYLWKNVGYNSIIYLSAISSIDPELYEAADIDGAGPVRKFVKITWPMLSPTTFFILITTMINSFKVFGTVNVMTQGGPGDATSVIVFYIYQTAFRFYKMGYAAAMSWILFIIIFAITLVQWQGQKKWVGYSL